MLKSACVAIILVPLCLAEAFASCTTPRSFLALGRIFSFKQPEPLVFQLYYKHDDQECKMEFSNTSRSLIRYSEMSVIERPKNGNVRLDPKNKNYSFHKAFIYTARRGYVGEDTFKIRLCAQSGKEKSCRPILYNVTIN